MYEQYTDKQIVEMLKPKLEKLGFTEFAGQSENYPMMSGLCVALYKSGYIRGQLGRSFIIGEKKAKEPVSAFKVGDKVKFLGFGIEDEETLDIRLFYPPVNTVGEVVELGSDYCFVQWPKGITTADGVWACRNKYLEKITERWVPATRDSIKVGSKVRYLNAERHLKNPEFYPAQGTIGKVVSVSNDRTRLVQWPGYPVPCFANRLDLEVLVDGLDEVEPTKAKKWAPTTKDNVKVGSKVRMIYKKANKEYRYYYPIVGVEGVVTNIDYYSCEVQWPEGAILGSDKNWYRYKRLEVLVCE